MSVFEMSRTEGKKFPVPPPGPSPAVLVAIVDLGSHEQEGENKQTGAKEHYLSRKVFLVWEMTDAKVEGYEDRNHFLGREYTLSLADNAHLRGLIRSWRGRDLDKDEGFKLATLLGRPCILNVEHKQSQKGNTFAVVGGATNPRKTDAVPPATVEAFAWEVGGGSPPPEHSWLPYVWNPYKQKMTHVGEKISESVEWKAWGATSPRAAGAAAGDPGDNDTIPF